MPAGHSGIALAPALALALPDCEEDRIEEVLAWMLRRTDLLTERDGRVDALTERDVRVDALIVAVGPEEADVCVDALMLEVWRGEAVFA